MALYKVEAINIRTQDIGEADKLITLFSKERGKIRAVAKGARRIRSRFGGRLELMVQHEALLVEGRELDQLSQAETINSFYKLRDKIETLTAGCYFGWVVDKATEVKQPNEPLYHLLRESLESLLAGQESLAVRKAFQKRFLEIEGILPQVGEDLTDKAFQEHFGEYAAVQDLMKGTY